MVCVLSIENFCTTDYTYDSFFVCSGKMSPEHALDGLFSVKSDVYSFGVVVIEIMHHWEKEHRILSA